MGKRKRGIGCRESESASVDSGYSEDPIQPVECKKSCLPGDVDMPDLSDPSMATSPQLFEPIECSNTNDELPTPATASDTRPIQQLRTSVRVQNKRKEENRSENSTDTLIKRGDICSQDEEEDDNAAGKTESADGEGKKRAWEVWSMEDKNLFFEGINECGKDFEAIQNFLMNKMRRRGNINYVPKNKEQVRHFYYRTWHKISKYVSFDTDARKATQELYGLINYGELRRKIGGTLDEKKGQKLQELIQKGTTSWRIKGKNIRVRTPICRALKKLNEFTDERDHGCFRVPTFITLTLSAGNMESWCHVQSVAHNPRVRIQCPLYKQLSSLFSLFERKWRSQEVKVCERLASSLALPIDLPSPCPLTMRLRPLVDAEINIAHIEPDTQMTSSAVSLASHEQYLKKNMLTNLIAGQRKVRKRSSKPLGGSSVSEDTGAGGKGGAESDLLLPPMIDVDSQDDGSDAEAEAEQAIIAGGGDFYDTGGAVKTEPPEEDRSPSPAPEVEDAVLTDTPDGDGGTTAVVVVKQENDALWQLKALQNVVNPPHDDADNEVVFVAENTRLLAQIRDHAAAALDLPEVGGGSDEEEAAGGHTGVDKPPPPLQQVEEAKECLPRDENQIRKGWTADTCGGIMIGELYLMFGKKKTLALEYVFEDGNSVAVKPQAEPKPETADSLEPLGETATAVTSTSPEPNSESVQKSENGDTTPPPTVEGCSPADSSSSSSSPAGASTATTSSALSAEKELARKEFSNVLERLVAMVKCYVTKPAPTADCIFCGSSSSRPSTSAKSPANSRSCAYGRSPGGHARSPRVPGSAKSPKNGASLHPKPVEDKVKPSSAKRLLACIPEEKEEKPVSATPLTDVVAVAMPVATDKPIQPRPPTVDATSGGFRVPLAPAPRVATAQSGFNAQLSKLLPKYSRARRTTRKNIFVQRQLPLLPSTAKKSQGFITLKILPQPGDASSSAQGRSIPPPILPNQVIPLSAPPSGSMPVTSSGSGISMPIIATLGQAAPISVNVSGQQLLTVQMPAFGAPLASARGTYPLVVTTTTTSAPSDSTVVCGESAFKQELGASENDVKPVLGTTSADALSGFDTAAAAGPDDVKIGPDFDVGKVSSDFAVGYPSTIPITPLHQAAFLQECKLQSEATCSTPALPELRDISFLELTPFSSPAKSKFSLSPLNCLNDTSSQLSLLAGSSSKPFGGEGKTISPIKLNLSSLLNSTVFASLESEVDAEAGDGGPLIPEFHIPESNDSLPALDVSIGGTLSIRTLGPVGQQPPEPKVVESPNGKWVEGDKEKRFPPNTPTKMMDITFASSNSNSNFSTLLAAAVGHAPLETESCDTLQTPPRSVRQQQQAASVTKKDPNTPFGLSFKANLFAGGDFSSASSGGGGPQPSNTTPSPPSSPSRLLLQTDQWLNNEVNDFSLSTLLSQLESSSPVKSATNSQKPTAKDDSCSLTSFLTDNSVDYMVTFAKFKAQIAKDNRKE